MPSDRSRTPEQRQDAASADSFPASDPPASMGGEAGARAVPPEALMDRPRRAIPCDAVVLRRRFASAEAAKLAVEALVRDGPMDRTAADCVAIGREVELRICADPEDVPRLRGLLAHA